MQKTGLIASSKPFSLGEILRPPYGGLSPFETRKVNEKENVCVCVVESEHIVNNKKQTVKKGNVDFSGIFTPFLHSRQGKLKWGFRVFPRDNAINFNDFF